MSTFIMHKNTPVIHMETATVLNHQLAPYPFKIDKINENDIRRWLVKRATPLTRKNADRLYMAAGLPRGNTEYELMMLTHGLSINDNYWIASEKDLRTLTWEKVNLYNNRLSEALSYLAFTGNTPTSGDTTDLSAEFTGQGTFPKCFVKNTDELELCKGGTPYEISAEVISSYIGKILGLDIVEYRYQQVFGKPASVCKIYTNENISWESAFWFTTFSEKVHNLNIYDFTEKYFPYNYYGQILLDGLVLNEDRHLQNWSIQLDGNTNNIIGMAPIYDLNKAFTGNSKSISNFYPGKNILYAAREAQSILNLDLISLLTPIIGSLPKQWQESFHNRILYISGLKGNQSGCY